MHLRFASHAIVVSVRDRLVFPDPASPVIANDVLLEIRSGGSTSLKFSSYVGRLSSLRTFVIALREDRPSIYASNEFARHVQYTKVSKSCCLFDLRSSMAFRKDSRRPSTMSKSPTSKVTFWERSIGFSKFPVERDGSSASMVFCRVDCFLAVSTRVAVAFGMKCKKGARESSLERALASDSTVL